MSLTFRSQPDLILMHFHYSDLRKEWSVVRYWYPDRMKDFPPCVQPRPEQTCADWMHFVPLKYYCRFCQLQYLLTSCWYCRHFLQAALKLWPGNRIFCSDCYLRRDWMPFQSESLSTMLLLPCVVQDENRLPGNGRH